MHRIGPLALLLLLAETALGEEVPSLAFPVDCALGRDCHIQQYVDRAAGPEAADFTCGPLSYDGHKGTDIRLIDDAAIAGDVPVLAAGEGVVRAVRDGMADIRQNVDDAPDVAGRECGNGVVLDHGGGWVSQYCHLKEGSVVVAEGEQVAAGSTLGAIGLSGMSEFPHLHFEVRQDERVVDPFDGASMTASCGAPAAPLWSEPVPYAAGGALASGIMTEAPDYEMIRQDGPHAPRLAATAPALVFWAHFFGVREGDELHLSLDGPEGQVAEQTTTLDRNRATQFVFAGRRRPDAGWPPGRYHARAELRRDGAPYATIEAVTEVE
ncbi:MAG: M23 family metallopeptidase [Pseudomonadota bacterium]